MIDILAIATIMAWPVIPLFWIPVHFATNLFRRVGLVTYALPVITWLPLAYLIYRYRTFFLAAGLDLPLFFSLIGIPLFAMGISIHIWTIRLLGVWGIIGVPEVSDRIKENLVTEGPFSVVRHPTYLAHTLIFSGVFLITGSITVGVIALLDCLIVNTVIIPLEEKEIAKRFGDDYEAYRKRVPSKFFPRFNKR